MISCDSRVYVSVVLLCCSNLRLQSYRSVHLLLVFVIDDVILVVAVFLSMEYYETLGADLLLAKRGRQQK